MRQQLALPVHVDPGQVAIEPSLGAAIGLCVKAARIEPKQVLLEQRWDKAQFSRWESGAEGIVWPKLSALMDQCGNDAPLMWMLHQRGYYLTALRKRETELQRELRQAREECAALRRVLASGQGA